MGTQNHLDLSEVHFDSFLCISKQGFCVNEDKVHIMLTCSIAPAGKDPINLRLSLVSTRSKIPDTFFTWLLATSGENPVLVQRGFNFPMGSFACTMTSMTCLWENQIH